MSVSWVAVGQMLVGWRVVALLPQDFLATSSGSFPNSIPYQARDTCRYGWQDRAVVKTICATRRNNERGSRIGHSSVVFKKQYGYRDGFGLITASAHLIHRSQCDLLLN